jgi:hypothetical protein
MPFMVREPHHERDCLIVNSSIYPFALSSSKGSERIENSLVREREWVRVDRIGEKRNVTELNRNDGKGMELFKSLVEEINL